MTSFKAVAEYTKMSKAQFFEQVVPEQKPIVIRGFAKNWPLVAAAQKSPHHFVEYLNRFIEELRHKWLLHLLMRTSAFIIMRS